MRKIIKSTTVIETETVYETEDIECTNLLKWKATGTTFINGEKQEEKQFCGICSKSVFEAQIDHKPPASIICTEHLANTHWTAKAILKSDMALLLSGEKTPKTASVMNDISFSNIDSDKYMLCLYGTYFDQLLTLDEKPIALPIPVNVSSQSTVGKHYNWSDVMKRLQAMQTTDEQTDCKVIKLIPKNNGYDGCMAYLTLRDDLYIKYQSIQDSQDRMRFILTGLLSIPEKRRRIRRQTR